VGATPILGIGSRTEVDVENLDSLQARLLAADSVETTLSVAGPVFEYMLTAANGYAESRSESFPMWISLTGPACEGRDALGTSPSRPREPGFLPADLVALSEAQAASELGRLSADLSSRLRSAAALTTDTLARHVCERAADAAEEMAGLLAPDS
jgi:hypothetical protein